MKMKIYIKNFVVILLGKKLQLEYLRFVGKGSIAIVVDVAFHLLYIWFFTLDLEGSPLKINLQGNGDEFDRGSHQCTGGFKLRSCLKSRIFNIFGLILLCSLLIVCFHFKTNFN